MWTDRAEAGRALGLALMRAGYGSDALVMGVPRGDLDAAGVADALGSCLDVVVSRKVGSPGNPEFAAGAVDADGHVTPNPDAFASDAYLRAEGAREHAEAVRRIAVYRGRRPFPALKDRTVVVVDDGIATGLTALAAARWLHGRGGRRLVLAVPVIAPSAVRLLTPEVDELVALHVPAGFRAVGEFYARFPQLTDADVIRMLPVGAGREGLGAEHGAADSDRDRRALDDGDAGCG
jgi:putative phosphoribosyl transferase